MGTVLGSGKCLELCEAEIPCVLCNAQHRNTGNELIYLCVSLICETGSMDVSVMVAFV